MPRISRRALLGGLAASPLAVAGRKSIAQAGLHIAIVGAGVFGTWIARALQQGGHRVTLIDAYGPANARASSGGESRVIRIAYGKDLIYSKWAKASLFEWERLSAKQTLPLFHRTGVLWMAPKKDSYIKESLKAAESLGMDVRLFDKQALSDSFPQMGLDGVGTGFLETETGALMARRAVQSLTHEIRQAGGRLLRAKAGTPKPAKAGNGVRIPLSNGEAITADKAVYACGPWLAKLFPDIIGDLIRPTRQEVFYFGPAAGDTRFLPNALPVWADFNAGDIYYGLPDLEGRGFKIAHDRHGPDIDPDAANRQVSDSGLLSMRAYLAKRFPDLAEAPLIESRVCQYENTPNGNFLIDRHPDMDSVWLVGGGSGHGFKHGPALGRYVADRVGGMAFDIEARFRLDTHNMQRLRQVH